MNLKTTCVLNIIVVILLLFTTIISFNDSTYTVIGSTVILSEIFTLISVLKERIKWFKK